MKFSVLLALMLASLACKAQSEHNLTCNISVPLQSDVLVGHENSQIGTGEYPHTLMSNNYADVACNVGIGSAWLCGGLRYENMKQPLPGYEGDFAGQGVQHFFVGAGGSKVQCTLGSMYEQFGSGMALRTYEERSLGIDNALFGLRMVLSPAEWLQVKALAGRQRRYWTMNGANIVAADVELTLSDICSPLADANWIVSVGASVVNKHEKDNDVVMADATHRLKMPTDALLWAARLSLSHGALSLLAEYARKGQDPTADNGYIYRHGNALLLSGSYSRKGLSVLLQAKRSDDIALRSKRSQTGTSSFLNHLPAFTQEHTYALATIYPYATQNDGEWALQAEVGYAVPKGTLLGGEYGTKIKAHLSHIRGLHKRNAQGMGSDGYTASFFQMGSLYYQDFDVKVDKKMSSAMRLSAMYIYLKYNQFQVEKHGEPMIDAHTYIAEGKFNLTQRLTLRSELQYMHAEKDKGDWLFGLLELSVLPSVMMSVSDEWNCGESNLHYYMGSVSWSPSIAHAAGLRLQAGYGRTRAGYNCTGGVCRFVPACEGATFLLVCNLS